MTREEQIIQASDEWTYQRPPQYSELVHKTHKVMCAYQIGFIDGAVWADSHPRWISVEDELPKENGRYLFYHERIGVQLAYYYKDLTLDKAVTHWMPLPAPVLSNSEKTGKNQKERR